MSELVLSLFPGIGLLDMAFEEEGFCVVRGPDVLWGGDVRRFHPPAGRFEGLIGEPPCQSYSSLASLVKAKGNKPRFGDLIPEYARVVRQARPRWFVMENVPRAPLPYVEGYELGDFLLDNSWLPAADGLGQEQRRNRRFVFGRNDGGSTDLLRHIQLTGLRLPTITGAALAATLGARPTTVRTQMPAVTQSNQPDNRPTARQRHLTPAVTADARAIPIRLGGSGKPKTSVPAVTGAHSGELRPRGGHLVTYDIETACRLQGLPQDFLADSPFTVEGKRKALGNGVPLPMGRAIARAIREALNAIGGAA